ncbi:hypothetical protein B0T20DRAFT_408471 [Sordaria brevicollis]|uniref:Uncharacterized protein n=1 Tax=Sordaria brevicollis TaxID=83679 RepID=A0AAE0UDR3_SORBR|nr:hypothetical protein B0T20DRAFT_408471 [Sordaria brevicollis]
MQVCWAISFLLVLFALGKGPNIPVFAAQAVSANSVRLSCAVQTTNRSRLIFWAVSTDQVEVWRKECGTQLQSRKKESAKQCLIECPPAVTYRRNSRNLQ